MQAGAGVKNNLNNEVKIQNFPNKISINSKILRQAILLPEL